MVVMMRREKDEGGVVGARYIQAAFATSLKRGERRGGRAGDGHRRADGREFPLKVEHLHVSVSIGGVGWRD